MKRYYDGIDRPKTSNGRPSNQRRRRNGESRDDETQRATIDLSSSSPEKKQIRGKKHSETGGVLGGLPPPNGLINIIHVTDLGASENRTKPKTKHARKAGKRQKRQTTASVRNKATFQQGQLHPIKFAKQQQDLAQEGEVQPEQQDWPSRSKSAVVAQLQLNGRGLSRTVGDNQSKQSPQSTREMEPDNQHQRINGDYISHMTKKRTANHKKAKGPHQQSAYDNVGIERNGDRRTGWGTDNESHQSAQKAVDSSQGWEGRVIEEDTGVLVPMCEHVVDLAQSDDSPVERITSRKRKPKQRRQPDQDEVMNHSGNQKTSACDLDSDDDFEVSSANNSRPSSSESNSIVMDTRIPRKTKNTDIQSSTNLATQVSSLAAGPEQTLTKPRLSFTKHNGGSAGGRKARQRKSPTPIRPGASLLHMKNRQQPDSDPDFKPSRTKRQRHGEANENDRVARRKSTRGCAKQHGKQEAPIEIHDDTSDEEEDDQASYKSGTETSARRVGRSAKTKHHFDAARIAIGNKVHGGYGGGHVVAEFDVKGGVLELRVTKRKTRSLTTYLALVAKIDLLHDEIKDLKYFLVDDEGKTESTMPKTPTKQEEEFEPITFIALQVVPTRTNMLTSAEGYITDAVDCKKRYVVVEFRYDEGLVQLLDVIKKAAFFRVDNAQLHQSQVGDYIGALLEDTRKDNLHRRGSMDSPKAKKTLSNFTSGRSEDDVLLVYPFDGDPEQIEKAAEGLMEACGNGINLNSSASTNDGVVEVKEESEPVESSSGDEIAIPEKSSRRHFLTIQVCDYKRLEPEEFLNDALIDFWMQWITRKLDPCGSKVHCFSSHFFSALLKDGPEAVEKWTKRKGINVFKKKFIFIPINEHLHWSLSIVVNPGDILRQAEDDPMTCLLFLDSLRAHQKKKVFKHVKKWLNSEWNRLHPDEVESPFDRNNGFQAALAPIVPYQDNSWDCGVFVCRYAYGMLSLLNCDVFRRNQTWFQRNLRDQIAAGAFDFNMDDIARLREEMKSLIERLSKIYLPWKEQSNRAEKQQKAQAKKNIAVAKSKNNKLPALTATEDEDRKPAASPAVTEQGLDAAAADGEDEFENKSPVPKGDGVHQDAASSTSSKQKRSSDTTNHDENTESKSPDSRLTSSAASSDHWEDEAPAVCDPVGDDGEAEDQVPSKATIEKGKGKENEVQQLDSSSPGKNCGSNSTTVPKRCSSRLNCTRETPTDEI